MIQIAAFVLTACFSLPLFASEKTQPSSPTLRLFIWEDYFPEQLLKTFEKQTGVKVEQVFYETDELKDETLVNTKGGEGLDLIVGSRTSFKEYQKYGWLNRYDKSKLTNLPHIEARWLAEGALNHHSVPYLWGTVGIGYRKDKISAPINSWKQLFKPEKKLTKRIMMTNDSRDTIGMALKSLGYSLNSTSASELQAAEQLLLTQKPFVHTYSYPEVDERSLLVKGDIWMAMLYNGDSLSLKEYNKNIAFVVPQEGTNLWIDEIAVLNASKNKAKAWEFVNFIHTPENAAEIAQATYYATPNKSARKLLPAEFLNDSTIYPSDKIIEKSEFFEDLSPKQLKKRGDIFLKILQ